MASKQGYSITTRRLRLCCRHPEWLKQTEEFYNQIVQFYYNLLLENPGLWELGSQKALRELEVLSIPGRDKRPVAFPLPWEKVPLYFRRAAANAGIAAAKSYLARREAFPGRRAQAFHSSAVFYKGMYRGFTSTEITLRVWDGDCWKWMRCRLYGKEFPDDAQLLSPSVVFEEKFIMLHVPVKEFGSDTATVKQRMVENRNLCSLQFTNTDVFAVGSVLDAQGQELAVKFWGGGKEYSHRCREILEKIEKSERSLGYEQCGSSSKRERLSQPDKPNQGRYLDQDDKPEQGGHLDQHEKPNQSADLNQSDRPNQKYWMHLKHLADFYAHQVSAEIVRFCQEQKVGVIVLPKFNENYTRYVMKSTGNWGPLHLSTRIRQYVAYKAWKVGIITIEVHAAGISSICAVCGKPVTSIDKKANEFICADGHRGNRYLNSARNLGRKCLIQFGKHVG
ncbi:transposase [Blautia schinkii]|nr:transposase [Blautia schinkii]